jgi:hypothetical protein
MTYEEAKASLSRHTLPQVEGHGEPGFLASLRPYSGLREENFLELLEVIRVLSPHLRGDTPLDKEIIGDLWTICTCARVWGLHPDGMLRRNGLVTPDDVARLEEWVDRILWAVMILLNDGDIESALQGP